MEAKVEMAAVGEAKAVEEAMGMAVLEEEAMGMAEAMGMVVVVADVMADVMAAEAAKGEAMAEAAKGEAIAADATEEKEGSERPCLPLFPDAMPQWRITQCEPYVRDREWRGRSRACARGIDTQQSGMGAGEGGEEGDRRRGDHLHAREGWEREGREEGAEAAHPR